MQQPGGTHWIPPAGGEIGEVGEFIGGDGVGAGLLLGEGEEGA